MNKILVLLCLGLLAIAGCGGDSEATAPNADVKLVTLELPGMT